MTLTKALWPPFPRPYWPQCACSEVCETDGSRRLRCRACGQLAERALPAKLKVGEEACAAIERAERLMAQLAVLGFRAELDAHGALSLRRCDLRAARLRQDVPGGPLLRRRQRGPRRRSGFRRRRGQPPIREAEDRSRRPRPLRRRRMGREGVGLMAGASENCLRCPSAGPASISAGLRGSSASGA